MRNIKRAFGFGDDDSDEDAYDEEVVSDTTGEPEPEAHVAGNAGNVEPEGELPLAIFDGVIAVFNAAQPDFIKSCLDVEAQRRYLYQAMDASLKEYLANLGASTRQKALQSWGEERTRMQEQLQEMQQLQRQAEENKAEQQQQKLSAQRQKRAFNDRISELEKRIAELEAEREQFELETKSLVNKLKVADVKDSDLAAQRDEIASLKERLKQAEVTIAQKDAQLKSASVAGIPAEDAKAMEEIQERLAQFEDVKRKKDAQIERQAARIAQLEGDLVALRDQMQQATAAASAPQEPSADGEKPRRRQRKGGDAASGGQRRHKAKISAIDENMDGIEWLLSTPGEDETVSKAVASSSDSDFGYQPPVRKEIVVDNDAQLSLF